MPVVVLRLDVDDVAALADCVAETIKRENVHEDAQLVLLLRQLQNRTRNSRHASTR